MSESELQLIRKTAIKLRSDILTGSVNFIGSEIFPIGCCGNASKILQSILINKGIKEVRYAFGWEEGKSHGWLEYKGYVIDITADQFSVNNEPVIIIPKSDSEFHKKFN